MFVMNGIEPHPASSRNIGLFLNQLNILRSCMYLLFYFFFHLDPVLEDIGCFSHIELDKELGVDYDSI